MKKYLPALAALALAGCTASDGTRMSYEDRRCARATAVMARMLAPDDQAGGAGAEALEFRALAASWTQGDRPIDVRQWVDDAQLVSRITNYCGSPEVTVIVNTGGRLKLVDVTLRPVPYERPARRGRVTTEIEFPPEEDEASPGDEATEASPEQ